MVTKLFGEGVLAGAPTGRAGTPAFAKADHGDIDIRTAKKPINLEIRRARRQASRFAFLPDAFKKEAPIF
jgi:hypothetical protein